MMSFAERRALLVLKRTTNRSQSQRLTTLYWPQVTPMQESSSRAPQLPAQLASPSTNGTLFLVRTKMVSIKHRSFRLHRWSFQVSSSTHSTPHSIDSIPNRTPQLTARYPKTRGSKAEHHHWLRQSSNGLRESLSLALDCNLRTSQLTARHLVLILNHSPDGTAFILVDHLSGSVFHFPSTRGRVTRAGAAEQQRYSWRRSSGGALGGGGPSHGFPPFLHSNLRMATAKVHRSLASPLQERQPVLPPQYSS
ncbi:hypothetical protein M8J77_022032 [Diaphorina citri]|nr:hypothetical protein M8J77_022032 [Diaphorina citri]